MDNLGQLIFSGVKGTFLRPEEREIIEKEKIGGIVLGSQNFSDPGQFAELINSIQKARDEYPLFISINYENEKNQRLKEYFSVFPSMLELAKLNSPKLIFEVHEVVAKELKACGVNMCLSPSCDILTNKENKFISETSYGSDPLQVEKFISAAIRGLQTNGILACAKYFPGLGEIFRDPQYELPLLKTSLNTIKTRELIPFIKASKSRIEFFMMGHVLVEEFDPDFPTTLSKYAYDFLRTETKFNKIILTDDLLKRAIIDRYSLEESALRAIVSGADILFISNLENSFSALSGLRESTKKRNLKKELLKEKISKVEKCKKEFLSNYSPVYIPRLIESLRQDSSRKLIDQLGQELLKVKMKG